MGGVLEKRALYSERVRENDSLRNLIECIVMLCCMLAPCLWWLSHIIIANAKGQIAPFCGALLFVLAFICLFVSSRFEELWDLFALIALSCVAPFIYLSDTIRSHVSSMRWGFFVLSPPRYRRSLPSPCRANCWRYGSRFCKKCDQLVESSSLLIGTRWLITRSVEKHTHHTESQLRVSVAECHLCNILLRSVCDDEGQFAESDSRPINLNPTDNCLVKIWQEWDGKLDKWVLFLQLRGSSRLGSRLLVAESNQLDSHACALRCTTKSQAVFKLAKEWIHACNNHPLCQKSFVSTSRRRISPDRLVMLESGIDKPKLRLINTDPELPLEYAALSHCWGDAKILKLLSTNEVQMKDSIEFELLAPNFQDAIEATLKIGLSYLWIDSLCIVQDSRDESDDWIIQAPKMGEYYANAACVLSATASESSQGGCFYPKDGFIDDCVLRSNDTGSLVVQSWMRNQSLELLFSRKVEAAPLTTRGWTFQERLLSKRIIHFCKGLVFFECNTMRASEYHEKGELYSRRTNVDQDGRLHQSVVIQGLLIEDDRYQRRNVTRVIKGVSTRPYTRPARDTVRVETKVAINRLYKSLSEKMDELSRLSALVGMRGAFQLVLRSTGSTMAEKMEFHQCWYEMVEQYSGRALTRQTDKLMALAGIGNLVQNRGDHTFVAGLWMQSLPLNLLWTRHDSSLPMRARPMRNLPTWSWASIDGVISHKLKWTPPHNLDQRGIGAVERFKTAWEHISILISDQETEVPLIFDNLIHNACLRITGFLFNFSTIDTEFIPDVDTSATADELFGLPILLFKNVQVTPIGSNAQVHGIVLRRVPNRVATFERFGYFWAAKDEVVTKVLDAMHSHCGIRLV